MALTPSTELPSGWQAPTFTLPTAEGQSVSLEAAHGTHATLVAFVCNHCPFVKHIHEGLARFADEYQDRGLRVIAINANDAEAYPEDRPARMLEVAREWGWHFPYLVDAQQTVAKAFQAACTPDLYLLDPSLQLFYHGQFDASRPGNGLPVTGGDLRAAADALLAGHPAPVRQVPSVGCNIKWKE